MKNQNIKLMSDDAIKKLNPEAALKEFLRILKALGRHGMPSTIALTRILKGRDTSERSSL